MFDRRSQSETIGILFMTGVVVITVSMIGVFVLSGVGGSDDPLLNADVSGNESHLIISHNGGDDFETSDLEFNLGGVNEETHGLETFTEVRGSDTADFTGGEKWVGEHCVRGETVDVRVIHEPSESVLDRDTITVRERGKLVFAVNSGGSSDYEAEDDGVTYVADTYHDGTGSTTSTSDSISGTNDDGLYNSIRENAFSYEIPVECGRYEVTFKFSENGDSGTDDRMFDVDLEGKEVITDLNVSARVGKHTAYDQTRYVTVTDGTLNIDFRNNVDNAMVSAIKIERAPQR